MPVVLACDDTLLLCYETAPNNAEVAAVTFARPKAHYLGPPNDEALSGHPLASRGLVAYGIFEVLSSSWVRSLSDINRVHHLHDPNRFSKLRHFVFTFHDATFEIVAEAVQAVKMFPQAEGLVSRLIQERLAMLGNLGRLSLGHS
jgi:hypothetical protein